MVGDSGFEPLTSCVSTTLGGNTEKLKNPFISDLLTSFWHAEPCLQALSVICKK